MTRYCTEYNSTFAADSRIGYKIHRPNMITELQNHIEPCLNYCALTDIWKASVKATHDFVSADDIEFYSDRIPRDYMPQMDMYAGHGQWCAFIGLSAEMIEMLFVRPDSMGKGYGSTLLRFAVEQKGIRKVDVNEQNTRASYFYKNHGFSVTGRDDTDAEGMPYPILHLELTEDK